MNEVWAHVLIALVCFGVGHSLSDKTGLSNAADKRLPLKETWPWYHSADEIHSSMQDLVTNCQGAQLSLSQTTEMNAGEHAGQAVSLDVVRIQREGNQPKKKAMLVYGEHARELISPESALHFAQTLCGHGPEAQRASKVLDNVSFLLVPNANPLGRKMVEDGYYCKRTNEDGVDLNRNFGDTHKADENKGDETNAGPSGFSEPESKMLKSLIDEERPDIYLSIHSGAYLLGTPFGYSADREPENEANMMQVLQPISEKYCKGECPYGNLAELIHYDSPGCDIDYVSEQLNTPYVYTWEIYVGERFRGPYLEEARLRQKHANDKGFLQMSFAQRQRRTRRIRKTSAWKKIGVSLRAAERRMEMPEDQLLADNCIDQFNPQTQQETESVTSTWTSAYLELCEGVVKQAAAAASSHKELGLEALGTYEFN